MIAIGLNVEEKRATVREYCASHGIDRIVALSPSKFRVEFEHERIRHTEWAEIVMYRHFYPILQETDRNTLVVVDECLRTTDRNCLTYNCIRHFLNQTPHAVVFQHTPILESLDDVMILVDFATQSRWKRERFDRRFLSDVDVRVRRTDLRLVRERVPTSKADVASYEKTKRKLFSELGARDPHTIPRTLHLLSGKAKQRAIDASSRYVGRNNRFALANMSTFDADTFVGDEAVFEFCHGHLGFSDFVALSRQETIRALVSDLRVDGWYADRFESWMKGAVDACAALQQ